MTDLFKKMCIDLGYADFYYPVKGSLVYLDHGCALRKNILGKFIDILSGMQYREFILPSYIRKSTLDLLMNDKIRNKYIKLNHNIFLSPTSELVAYDFMKRNILHCNELKMYSLDSAFRFPKNTVSPFILGERKSYLTAYSIERNHNRKTLEENFISMFEKFSNVVENDFLIPFLRVERPHFGNLDISKRTLTCELIIPSKTTVTGPMFYYHDDIFTKMFDLDDYCSIHFGVTDNLIIALMYYYFNIFGDGGFMFPFQISPFHILLCGSSPIFPRLKKCFSDFGIRYREQSEIPSDLDVEFKKSIYVIILGDQSSCRIKTIGGEFSEIKNDSDAMDIVKCEIKMIIEKLKIFSHMRKNESIVECESLDQINFFVKNKKIAKTDIKIGSKIYNGEILVSGGECIGRDLTDPNMFYISRRI